MRILTINHYKQMKYLSDYCNQGITRILTQYGAFYAFSDKQLAEQRQEGVTYVSLGSGLICPKEHADTVVDELIANGARAVQQDIEENGIERIIIRELYNHEAFYTGDLEDTLYALEPYNVTLEQLIVVYRKESKRAAQLN